MHLVRIFDEDLCKVPYVSFAYFVAFIGFLLLWGVSGEKGTITFPAASNIFKAEARMSEKSKRPSITTPVQAFDHFSRFTRLRNTIDDISFAMFASELESKELR